MGTHSVETLDFQKALCPNVHHLGPGGAHASACERFQSQVLRQKQIAPACGNGVVIGYGEFDQDVSTQGGRAKLGLFAAGR